jgi:biopolymer transport protein ExbB
MNSLGLRHFAAALIVAAGSLAFAPSMTPALAADTAPTAATTPASAGDASAPSAVPVPADAPAVAVLPPAPAATADVNNPYGLTQLWSQGDFVARGTIVILLIMSIGTWYIAILKLIEQARVLSQARVADKKFWDAGSVQESIGRLKEGNAFRQIAETGLSATEHHEGTLVERIDLHTWVTMSIQRSVDTINARLQRGLAFLATVGSTAPFVGLFGTVWGIYHALVAIGLAGQASIDKVAGPVGEALIMTAIGLFVAVPAVLGYNWLVRRNKVVSERVKAFSSDLHSVLLSGAGAAQAARAQPAALRPAPIARTA